MEYTVESIEFKEEVILIHYGNGIGTIFVRLQDMCVPRHLFSTESYPLILFNIDERGNRMRRFSSKMTVVTFSRETANQFYKWMDAQMAKLPEPSWCELG